jgi:hypothetical protein
MGGLNLKVEMSPAFEDVPWDQVPEKLFLTKDIALPAAAGEHAYWIKVLQNNGNAAWSSPVFVTVKPE